MPHQRTDESPDIDEHPYAIAMFDVLGFEALVRAVGLKAVHDKYHALIESAVAIPDGRYLNAVEGAFVLGCLNNHDHAYFSDTILLWAPLNRVSAAPFVGRCAELVASALRMDIPLRGALALGPAIMDRQSSIYLGEPYIEAARLEAQTEWIGMSFCSSAMWPGWIEEMWPQEIVQCQPPMKDESKRRDLCGGFAVNWSRHMGDEAKAAVGRLRNRAELAGMSDPALPSILRKYDNSLQFIDASQQWVARMEREKIHRFKVLDRPEVTVGGHREGERVDARSSPELGPST